jgi:hypothetical protein
VTVPERVAEFLRQRQGELFCDECIKTALDLKRHQQAQQAAAALGASSEFLRTDASCSKCRHHRKVTGCKRSAA